MKLALLFTLFLFSSINNAAQNIALVIGNSQYQKLPPLTNTVNDAFDISKNLTLLGFEVTVKYDLNRKQMRESIREFGRQLKQHQGAGIFFYAGHGAQVKGKNYLIPIGSDIKSEFEIPDETVEADSLLRTLDDAKNPLNIVVLDACRDNPFASSFRSATKGLARMEGGTGVIIGYSTSPGKVASDGGGRNSPYTKYLLKYMTHAGLSIEQVFKRVRVGVEKDTNGTQTPWETSSLKEDFYFVPEQKESYESLIPVESKKKVTVQQSLLPTRVEYQNRVVNGKKLVVYTNPQEAQIRLLNTEKIYHSGVMLEPGDYNIEISKEGFLTKKQWITIDQDDIKLQITLVPF